jgi:hypothetical protein
MVKRTKQEVSDIIERFVAGTGGKWDWDDFCTQQISNSDLDQIRIKCAGLDATHPPAIKGHFCNDSGIQLMREMIRSLRDVGKSG